MVQNFQHNWETNPQFRAIWSGGLGLGIIVVMCACLGFAFTFASAAAASLPSAGGSNTGSAYTAAPNGTVKAGSADSTISFPTQTAAPWSSQQVPAGQLIPPSLTPAPSPTAPPTPTPAPTSTAGPGGGGGGGGGTVTVTASSLHGGANGTIDIQTSVPNAQVNIFVKSWPGGGSSPTNQGSTDANGKGVVLINNVPNPCNGTVSIWVKTDVSGQISTTVQCTTP